MSSTATGSGNDERKRKEHHDKLLGSKSYNNREGDAIGVAKKDKGVAATGVDIAKKEEAVVKEEVEDVAVEPYTIYVQGAGDLIFDEEEVEALGLPILEDFVVQSSFDNRSYLAKLCLINLKYRDGDSRLFRLVGTIREALQDPIRRGETIWFRKEGDVVICE